MTTDRLPMRHKHTVMSAIWCRRVLLRVLSLLLALALMPIYEYPALSETPIEIRNAQELADISKNLSASYILASDINLAGIDWTPIADFSGVLDGGGHVILGLIVTADNDGYAGLFGRLDARARIKNLRVEGARLDTSAYYSSILGMPEAGFDIDIFTATEYTFDNCNATGTILVNAKASGDYINAFALIGAINSTANVDITITAENANAHFLYACVRCESDGSMEGKPRNDALNGFLCAVSRSADSKNAGDIHADQALANTTLTSYGVGGYNDVRSKNCENKGDISIYGTACGVQDSENSVNRGSLRAKTVYGVVTCTGSANYGRLKNHEETDTEHAIFPIYDTEDDAGNENYGEIRFTPGNKSVPLIITSALGKGSVDNAEINIDGGVCPVDMRLNACEDAAPYSEAAITLKSDNSIKFLSNIDNYADISLTSRSSSVNATAGVHNYGDITVSAGGDANIIGARKANRGAITVRCGANGSVIGATGDQCYNDGNITLEGAGASLTAFGVKDGTGGYNGGGVSVKNTGAGNAAAFGAYCTGGVNTGAVEAEALTGSCDAGGVGMSSSTNYGSVTATSSGNLTHAFGYPDAGVNGCESYGTVRATNLKTQFTDTTGIANAHGYSGEAYAQAYNQAYAWGVVSQAASTEYGLSVTTGNIGYRASWHSNKCSCGQTYRIVSQGENFQQNDGLHYWTYVCGAYATGDASQEPPVVEPPVVEPPERDDPNGKLTLALFEAYGSKKVEYMVWTSGSYSYPVTHNDASQFGESLTSTDYSRARLRLSVTGGEPNAVTRVTVRAPEGFSFTPSGAPEGEVDWTEYTAVRSISLELTLDGEGEDMRWLDVYPLYNPTYSARANYTAYGDLSAVLLMPVNKNANAGIIGIRASALISAYDEMDDATPNVDVSGAWDPMQFTKPSSNYSSSLALVSASLAGAAYRRNKVKTSLENLGFSQIRRVNYSSGNDQIPLDNNLVACAFGAKNILVDNQVKTIVAIIIRGTVTTEWEGNIRFGNGTVHDSFDRSQAYVYSELQTYLSELVNEGELIFYLSSHSRGAAVGDLLATRMMREGGVKAQNLFAYGFATPSTSATKLSTASNIFNVCFEQDIVAYVPYGYFTSGRKRYITEESYLAVKGTFDREYSRLTGKVFLYPDNTGLIGILMHSHLLINPNLMGTTAEDVADFFVGFFAASKNALGFTIAAQQKLLYHYYDNRELTLYDVYNDFVPWLTRKYLYPGGTDATAQNIAIAHSIETYIAWIKSGASFASEPDPLVAMSSAGRCMYNIQQKVRQTIIDIDFKITTAIIKTETRVKTIAIMIEYLMKMLYINTEYACSIMAINTARTVNKLQKMIRIRCPVDVMVYDENHTLVSQITGGSGVEDETATVVTTTDGDDKFVYTPLDQAYTLEIIGYEDGVMNIELYEFDEANRQTRCVSIASVPVVKGETAVMTVNAERMTALENYALTLAGGRVMQAMEAQTEENTLLLPDAVTEIQKGAFQNSGVKYVIIPGDSLAKIDAKAFSGCKNLLCVTIYARSPEIAGDAFDADAVFMLRGVSGGTVEAYANQYAIPFESISETEFD